MLESLYPDKYLKSVDEIDFEEYYKQGIRGIISDIDNTLVPHGAPADEHIINVFEKIHQLGIETCLISNNKEPRVKPFADAVNSKYIFDAHKPSKKNYIKAMKIMGTNEETTLFLGDQIFTDVWGQTELVLNQLWLKKLIQKKRYKLFWKEFLKNSYYGIGEEKTKSQNNFVWNSRI